MHLVDKLKGIGHLDMMLRDLKSAAHDYEAFFPSLESRPLDPEMKGIQGLLPKTIPYNHSLGPGLWGFSGVYGFEKFGEPHTLPQ